MTAETLTSSAEFPEATAQRWGESVAATLSKGGRTLTPEQAIDSLTSVTSDGIAIRPLYTDAPTTNVVGVRTGPWEIRQLVDVKAGPGRAVEELERGANSITLDLGDDGPIDAAGLAGVLDGVLFDVAGVALRTGRRWHDAAQSLLQVWAASDVPAADVCGLLGADPLGVHLVNGVDDIDGDLELLGDVAVRTHHTHPGVRVAAVSGWRIDAAGGSPAEVLGCVVACGVAYLRAITGRGVAPAVAFAQIELQVAATVDQFVTIAELRALRVMWGRVADALGVPDAVANTPVHAVTSTAMVSVDDPWVNALRDTVACFAAAVGGADSIEVVPFDVLVERPDGEQGRRLARNTQSILELEANLGRVADPAAGSWYVESLTAELADAGWAWFQEIEAAGGYRAAIDRGLIAERLAETWAATAADVDTRRRAITGVTEFPNIGEPRPTLRPASEPSRLPTHRLAERFEILRRRVEAADDRPIVFLAAIGSLAASAARVGYATSFFEIAGLRTTTGQPSTTASEVVDAWRTSGARVVCLCSSDAMYADHAVAVVAALHDAGAASILIAGRPRDLDEPLRAAGLREAIYVGCDARTILADLVDQLLPIGGGR